MPKKPVFTVFGADELLVRGLTDVDNVVKSTALVVEMTTQALDQTTSSIAAA